MKHQKVRKLMLSLLFAVAFVPIALAQNMVKVTGKVVDDKEKHN